MKKERLKYKSMNDFQKKMTSLINEVANSADLVEIHGGDGGKEPITNPCGDKNYAFCGDEIDTYCVDPRNAGGCPSHIILCFLND